MKKLFTLLFVIACANTFAQNTDTLSVEKIMSDTKWIGVMPSRISWSDDSKKVYFELSPDHQERGEHFSITINNTTPQKVSVDERRDLPGNGTWNKKHTLKVYAKGGDIFLDDVKTGKIQQLTNTTERKSDPYFSAREDRIFFTKGDNLYALNLGGTRLDQLTNFVKAASKKGGEEDNDDNDQAKWLKAEQLELFDIIKVKEKDKTLDAAERKALTPKKIKELVTGGKDVGSVVVSPDGHYITYQLTKQADGDKAGIVPNYVTASGYTEDIPNRSKVGGPQATYESFVYDTQRDTVYKIITQNIPGIKDLPDYVKDYPKELADRTKLNDDREVAVSGPFWSEDSRYALTIVDAVDNKDRWIMKLDAAKGSLSILDRQHDNAWVTGAPGIDDNTIGWLDNTHFYYQSEASGYTHIYVADITTGDKKNNSPAVNGKYRACNYRMIKRPFISPRILNTRAITSFTVCRLLVVNRLS